MCVCVLHWVLVINVSRHAEFRSLQLIARVVMGPECIFHTLQRFLFTFSIRTGQKRAHCGAIWRCANLVFHISFKINGLTFVCNILNDHDVHDPIRRCDFFLFLFQFCIINTGSPFNESEKSVICVSNFSIKHYDSAFLHSISIIETTATFHLQCTIALSMRVIAYSSLHGE